MPLGHLDDVHAARQPGLLLGPFQVHSIRTIPVVDVTGDGCIEEESSDPFRSTVYASQLTVAQLITVSRSASTD
jgi:hypothetical protein